MGHSLEFKSAVVKKVLMGGKTQKEIADEAGIGRSTLVKWMRDLREDNAVTQRKPEKRPKDWSAEERFAALLETNGMADDELGAWCRRNGLHTHHIAAWRRLAIGGCAGRTEKKERTERRRLQQENRELKRDLGRKEKALAEVTALLVLKKKVDALWPVPGED